VREPCHERNEWIAAGFRAVIAARLE